MQIQLNGEPRHFDRIVTVAQLLVEIGLGERRVAVEVNREIVPRSEHARRELRDADRVEVVVAIGGG